MKATRLRVILFTPRTFQRPWPVSIRSLDCSPEMSDLREVTVVRHLLVGRDESSETPEHGVYSQVRLTSTTRVDQIDQ